MDSTLVLSLQKLTVWSGTHYDCKTVVMVLRGIAQGVPTLQLAEELDLDYSTLLSRRHQIQEQALQRRQTGLPDQAVEADEMFQNAGKKADPHPDPDDPPRRRANKQRGRGTYESAVGALMKTTVRRRSGWWDEPAESFA